MPSIDFLSGVSVKNYTYLHGVAIVRQNYCMKTLIGY